MGCRDRRRRDAEQVALQILKSIEARTLLINSWFQTFLGRAAHRSRAQLLPPAVRGRRDRRAAARRACSDRSEYFDAVGDYKGTINWGDGTTTTVVVRHTTATGQVCVVEGNHAFPNQGDIPITIDITDPDGHTQTFDGVLRIQLPPLPPPGKANVQPFGTVLIKVNGKFVPLTGFRSVPIGSSSTRRRGASGSLHTTARPGSSSKGSSSYSRCS